MAKKAAAKRVTRKPAYKIPGRDYALHSGKSLRIQSVEFKRTPMGTWEHGLMVCEREDSPLVDMDGRVVVGEVYDWRQTHDLVIVFHDKGE